MKTDQWPAVLCLMREIPQTVNAGSLQLFRVLTDYPPDRLMVIGPAPHPAAERLPCRYATLELRIKRWIDTRLHCYANLANVVGLVRDFDARVIDGMLGGFRPDLVLTVMDCYSYYKWAWRYAKRRALPLLTITMDDPTQFERVPGWATLWQRRAIRRIYRKAARSLGVCREMSAHLRSHYGRDTETFHFGPPHRLAPRAAHENETLRKPPRLTLGYAGALGYYGHAVLAWLPALEAADACLRIYGGESDGLVAHPRIVHCGRLPPEDLWERVKRECDAVMLAYSFDDTLAHLHCTHFPTKLSEYCTLGMPLVVTGPSYATGVRWALEHADAALCVTTPDQGAFANAVRTLTLNARFRRELGAAALAAARREFDPETIRRGFVEHLRDVARQSAP